MLWIFYLILRTTTVIPLPQSILTLLSPLVVLCQTLGQWLWRRAKLSLDNLSTIWFRLMVRLGEWLVFLMGWRRWWIDSPSRSLQHLDLVWAVISDCSLANCSCILATQLPPIVPIAPTTFSGHHSRVSLEQQQPTSNVPPLAPTSSNSNIQSPPAASHPAIPPVKTLRDAVKQWLYGDEQELWVPLKEWKQEWYTGVYSSSHGVTYSKWHWIGEKYEECVSLTIIAAHTHILWTDWGKLSS